MRVIQKSWENTIKRAVYFGPKSLRNDACFFICIFLELSEVPSNTFVLDPSPVPRAEGQSGRRKVQGTQSKDL